MGKTGTVKKRVIDAINSDTGTTNGKNDDSTRNVRELEERLQRLENVHTKSSSDVFKFAFFFFMGIALTIVIYPMVSKTVDSLGSSNGIRNVNRESDSPEDFKYVNEPASETKYDSHQSDSLSNKNKSTTIASINEIHEESYEQKDAIIEEMVPIKEKPRQDEDMLIGEESDDDETLETTIDFQNDNNIQNDEQTSELNTPEIHMKMEPTDSGEVKLTPERVELFSANVDDIKRVDPIADKPTPRKKETRKAKTDKFKDNTSKTSEKKNNKSKKDKKQQKENKSDKAKSEASEVSSENLPKEIKNFRATYLKQTTPKKIFSGGRRIPPMELLPQKPNNSSVKVWMFEEFLSEEECDGLMRVHNKHVTELDKDSPILCFDSVMTLRKHLERVGRNVNVSPRDFTQGTTCVNETFSTQLKEWLNGNWSYSTAFYPGESRFATAFEQRVKEAMGLEPANGGKFQITSYPEGIGYKTHTDCTEESTDLRDRVATVLVYLDTIVEGGGGETEFPELGIWVRPRKARALLWNNMNTAGDCEPMSVHKAAKVVKGHKFILQRWYYYKSFYSLGKRPPEPPLPVRKSNKPRVSCDEYEHGSCRWYDEWNFEHMVEYERKKYTLV